MKVKYQTSLVAMRNKLRRSKDVVGIVLIAESPLDSLLLESFWHNGVHATSTGSDGPPYKTLGIASGREWRNVT